MSDAARSVTAEEVDLPSEISHLLAAVERLPVEYRRTLDPLCVQVVSSTQRRRKILKLVQDALGQLRLDMKYLLFDLEATRRERDEYRRQIEGHE